MGDKKKFASTFDVIKQSVREKITDTEIHEDPAVRAQITKVEDHRRLVTELSRHLTSLKKSHAVGKQEEKNLIESWTQYADKLAKDADCPELEKAMRKLVLVEKYIEEITGKMNDHFSEKAVTPVHNYGETELREALRWKDRYNDIRVRYDALCAKKSSSEKHANDKIDCQKELEKMGEQTIDALKKAYARSESVHFEAIIGRYEALAEFFDLGQLYLNERKAEIAQFKLDWERRKTEIATGKKIDATRAPNGTTVFGVALLELLAREKRPDTDVPMLVEKCCEYLYAKGLDSEGLFRVSPAGSQLEKFKANANQNNYDFSWISDPNVVAGGLKFFLRSLPDPIFTSERYRAYLNCIGRGDETLELEALKKVVDNLPPQNHVLVKSIMLLLKAVLEHEDKNKMSPKALCVVMGPNLLWSREATRPEDMMVDSEKTNALLTLMMRNVPYLFTEKNIWKVIRRGDLEGMKKLAESEKIDLASAADESGQLILHVAAKCGFLNIVKYMIEEVKVPVDTKDLLEVTALGHALMNKNEEVALYLIEKRANTKSDYRDKVDFEPRAKMIGPAFHTKYLELIAKVAKEDKEKAETEAKRKQEEREKADRDIAAKIKADEEARWARELEIAQKRAARENPALAALGAQVIPANAEAEAKEEKEAREREEKEQAERAAQESARLAALVAADKEKVVDTRASMAPPLPSQRPLVGSGRSPGSHRTPAPQPLPPIPTTVPAPPPVDPDTPPTPLTSSMRVNVPAAAPASAPSPTSAAAQAPNPFLGPVPSNSTSPAASASSAPTPSPSTEDPALPRLESLMNGLKLNITELLAAVCRLVRLSSAREIDLPACNAAVRELAVEVKSLFTHVDDEVLAESSDEERDAFFTQARKIQEGMKTVIGALKEVSQSAEPADRIPALLRSLAFIVTPSVALYSAFELLLASQINGYTGAAANQLTTALQIAVGKSPAAELPSLAAASQTHYGALAELVRQHALEVADPDASEKLNQAATSLLSSRTALFQTAQSLLSTPSDDIAKANLSAVAKVLAAQFTQLNTLAALPGVHRALSAAARAAAEAQEEKETRNLRDLISMLSLPTPDVSRKLSAALEALVLLRTIPITNAALFFDACNRIGEAVRGTAKLVLNMRSIRSPDQSTLLRELTRHVAASVHLSSFIELIGSGVVLNVVLEPVAVTHVSAALLHSLAGVARLLGSL